MSTGTARGVRVKYATFSAAVVSHVIPPAIGRFVLDTDVGEVDLLVEVRQVAIVRPVLDFGAVAIRPSVGIVAVLVTLVQPSLIVALELVIERNTMDPVAALLETLRLAQVRAKHLAVVFHLAWLLQLRVEGLLAVLAGIMVVIVRVVAAMRFEEAAPIFRENDGDVTMTVDAFHPNQSLFPKMSQVACARVGWPSVVIAEVA